VGRTDRTGEVFDAHAHIVPLSLLAELSSRPRELDGFSATRTGQGWVVSVPGMGETRPIGARMTEPELRREWMARIGVSRQVLSPWLDIQAGKLAAGPARDWARRLNDAMAGAVRELGGGTVALASIDTTDGEQAATDLEQAWARPEFAGLVLNTNPVTGPELHEPSLDPLWTVAERYGIPVVLHPPNCGPSGAIPTLGGMGNVHGRLVDNTLTVTQLILHGVLDRHPGLRFVLVHGGGFLPYQAQRLDGGYRTGETRVGPLEREAPSAYLGDFYYDTVALSAPAIAFITGLVGPGRVLLGTDYPFALSDPEPVRTVQAAGLPADETAAILSANATDLFGGKRVR
jgi:aminocarboxymuconate-semialdehyde decarboxylase